MTLRAELHSGGIHDNFTEPNADHVVVVDNADVYAVQVGQCHHQLLAAHSAAVGVLPLVLKTMPSRFTDVFTLHLFQKRNKTY